MTNSWNNFEYLEDNGEKSEATCQKQMYLSLWIPWICTEFVSSKNKRQISSSFIETKLYLSQLLVNDQVPRESYL